MKYGRHEHGVIFYGEKFLIIGGNKGVPSWDRDPTNNEVCTLKGSNMTCVESTALEDYYSTQLFLVDPNFGKC